MEKDNRPLESLLSGLRKEHVTPMSIPEYLALRLKRGGELKIMVQTSAAILVFTRLNLMR